MLKAPKKREAVRDAIVIARQKSRAIGIGRLKAEADSAGAFLGELSGANAAAWSTDWTRATRIAQNYSVKLAAKTAELESRNQAVEALAPSLERVAVTESSQAFSAGRQVVTATQLMKIWNAELDKRTCFVCSQSEGTIVSLAETFSAGEPGDVHPWCRCTWTLLTMQESEDRVLIRGL